jgi:hypothetical protein
VSSEAKKIVGIIKTRGYWEVDLRPIEQKEDRFESIPDCIKKVSESVVRLRGWPYPLYLDNKAPPYPMDKRIEACGDFGGYKEYWTMFLSGHFYHIFGCREDWLKEEISIFGPSSYSHIKPGTMLDFICTLYSVTEIFEFAIRLAQRKIFGNGVKIKVSLSGMEGRNIRSFDLRRWIPEGYICRSPKIDFEKKVGVEELLGQGHQIALDATVYIFGMFSWFNVNQEVLNEEQRKFLEKRI